MWICLPNMLVGQASEWTLVVSGPVVFHWIPLSPHHFPGSWGAYPFGVSRVVDGLETTANTRKRLSFCCTSCSSTAFSHECFFSVVMPGSIAPSRIRVKCSCHISVPSPRANQESWSSLLISPYSDWPYVVSLPSFCGRLFSQPPLRLMSSSSFSPSDLWASVSFFSSWSMTSLLYTASW